MVQALSAGMVAALDAGDSDAAFFFSSRRRHTRSLRDWSSDVCSSDLKSLDGMRNFIKPAPKDHVLYTNLRDKLAKLEGASDADKEKILAAGEAAVGDNVYGAYKTLIAYFETIDAKVTESNGVWALPDGDKFYAWCVKNHTTLPLTPDEVHATGLREVARIEGEIDTILKAQGLKDGTVGARMAKLAADPAQLWPEGDAGYAAALAEYQRIIDEIS